MVAMVVFLASVIFTLYIMTLDNERFTALATIVTLLVAMCGALFNII